MSHTALEMMCFHADVPWCKCFVSVKLGQVSHVRSLHTSACGQQQEAVAVKSEPAPFSVIRTQEDDPVSKLEFKQFNCCYWANTLGEKLSTVASLSGFTLCLFLGMSDRQTYWAVLHTALWTCSHCVPSRPSLALQTTGMCSCLRRHEQWFKLQRFGYFFWSSKRSAVKTNCHLWVLGEDIQWRLCDGEVSSSRGHFLLKTNRPEQTGGTIFILYPSKHTLCDPATHTRAQLKICRLDACE